MRGCFVALALAVGQLAAVTASEPSFYLGGTQVHEPDHDHWVETIRQVGMNTVAVTVYARQADWDGDDLRFADGDAAVLREIRAAKARGLAVVLTLRVALDHAHPRNKFLWHGMIMPRSEQLLRSWFEKYTRFVVQWATICEREGVDILGIGSELNALNASLPIDRLGNAVNYYKYTWYQRLSRKRAKRFAEEIEQRHLWVRGHENYETLEQYLDDRFELTAAWARQIYLRKESNRLKKINRRRELILGEWIGLIDEVRRVYRGKLTYAANFDSYHTVGFWSHLDLIGINAYFSLRPHLDRELEAEEKLAAFTRRWRSILARIEAFKQRQRLDPMPFLFTELGYTFRRHSTVAPWAHSGFSVVGWKSHERRLIVWGEQPVDYEERRLALAALQTVHRESASDLAGILYWKLSTDRTHERIEPFVVHIGTDSKDRLQSVLLGFVPLAGTVGR